MSGLSLSKIFRLEKVEKQMIYFFSIALFLVLNLVVSSLSFRLDFSYGQAYSLSPSTKKILSQSEDLVKIKFFASSDIPRRLIPLKTEVSDLLNEYDRQGGKNIQIFILDPKKDDNALEQAREAGLPELQFSQLEKDKYAISKAYFGVVIAYGDKKEVIPQVTEVGDLEYNITSAIYKLVSKQVPKIGIIGYKEEFNPQKNPLQTLEKVLKKQFNLQYLDISSSSATKKLDKDIKALMVFDDGKRSFDKTAKERLENYLKDKGNAVFFVNGVWVNDRLTTSPANHQLFSLFKKWGLVLNKDLVLSTSAEVVNFGNQLFAFLTPYPFWLKTAEFNRKAGYFSNVSQLTFPWASSISVKKNKRVKTRILVKTTPRSWLEKDNFILDPSNIPQPSASDLKQFVVAVEARKEQEGNLVLISSSRFVLDRFLSRNNNNIEFVSNILSNLASGGALAGIRSRAIAFYPLPDLPEKQKDLFKYLNILLLPSILGLVGGLRMFKRK